MDSSRGALATSPVSVGTAVLCSSDIDIVKSGPETVSVGGAATYVVTVTNTGPAPLIAGQLTLADATPVGLTFNGISAQSGACAFSGASPWTNTGTLAVGESCSVTLGYTVTAAACPAGVLFNRAQATTQTGDTDQAVAVTAVGCDTSLDIDMTPLFLPEELVAGTIVDFEITVENTGNITAYDVELTGNVYLPQPGARIVDFFPESAFSAGECTNGGFCNLGDLPAGESVSVIASVEIDPDQALYFPNFLVKDACAEAGNADPICLADREQIFEELILGDAELSITKQTLFDPIVVSSGYVAADGYYVLEVRNEGFSDAAPGVVISDTLPLGMVISGEPVVTASYGYGDIGLDCSGSVGNGVLSCVLDNPLPAWETLQIVVPVGFEAATAANFCVSPGNSFNNVAQVLWTDDVDIEQSALSNAVTSNFICRGDVDVIKSGPAAVTYAEAAAGFAYTVTVQNTGPSPIAAGGVTVTDVLPTGLFFDAAAAVNGGACGFATTAQTGDGVVVFTNATPLGAGESCTVTFGVTSAPSGQTPDAGLYTAGDLFNVVTVRAGSDVAQAVAQTQIDFSTQLTITKQALGPVVAGAEAIFEIVITNTGDAPAFDLLLTDNANARSPIDPLGAQIVGMSIVGEPAGLCTDGGLCRIDTLAAKDSITVLATVLVDADTLSSEARQQACVAAANAPSTCAAVSAEIERVTDVRIRKDDLGNVLVAGGAPVQYIITVWNENGPSTAYDVVVRDEMLPGFTLVGDLEPGSQRIDCPDVPNAGDNVCIIRALRPGDSVELYATVAAAADAVDAVETPVNQACVVEIDGVAPVNPLCDSESSNVITRADLALVKNAPATVSAGDPITYTIDVVNLGPSNAQNVTVADVLPPQLSAVSIGADQGGCSSLPCALGMLPAGASAVITINAIVDNAVLVGSSIENVATVSTSTIDPNPTNDSDDADTSVVGSADLSLSKRGPATITAGTEIEYTITITNNGPSTAPGVNVNDALPVGMTLVEATIQRSGNGLQLCGGLVCQLDKMAVGETAVVTLRALVSPNLTAGTVLTNTATIFGVTEDTNTANNSASVVTVVGSVADVAVSVLDLSDPVQPTGGFVYDIAVTNNGPSMARGVVLTDVLDANVTFSSMSPACPLNGDTLTCNVGNLRVGDTVRFLLAVTAADVPNGTQLVNTATVTTSTTDPVAENNVDSEFTTVQLGFGPSADVSVSKSTSTALVNAGEFVTYTMIVSNAGPVEATDVKLIEVIPAGTRLVAITVDNPSFASATCSLSGICLLGTLPVGVNATVTARLLVETSYADTVVNNLVTVLADQIDPQPRNNIDLAAVAVNPFVPLPSVQVTKELARTGEAADGVVPVGERITFTITLANDGELQIVDMPLIDTYDATKLSFVSASTPPSSVAPLGTLLWDNLLPDVLSLAPGDSFQVVTVFDTVGSSATSIDGLTENTATVNAAEGQNGETAPAVSDTATIRVTAPGVAIRKEVDASTPAVVLPGDLITYSITVSNTGDTRLTTVPVIDRFDADHLTFVSAQIPPTSTAAEEIRWADVGDIEPGEALSFTVTFRVTGDVPFVDNVAVLGIVGDENGDTALDSSGQTLVEVGVARLGFELDSLPAPGTEIRPGDVVTYYLRLVNRGGIPLTNVTLVTQVPEGTTLLRFEDVPAARSTPNESAEQDNVYEWQFGTMAVNEAFQTLMIVQVNQDTTLQVISMDAAYSSAETAAGQSNELTHPLSPTAITLEYFTVEQKEGGVLVRWKTAAEVNSWGFYVLRSEYGKNERTRVNPTLIPATGAGSVYEYFDTGAGSGQVYEYWLQEIELDGDVLEYGPTVVGSGVERVYLPIVER